MSDEKQTMYEITVTGQYISSDKLKKVAPFTETFELPVCGGEARAEIQNRRIGPKLQAKYPDFKRVRTCQIISEKIVGAKANAKPAASKLEDMTLDELSNFVLVKKLKSNVGTFANLEEAKRAVQKELDDIAMAKKLAAEKKRAAASKKSAGAGKGSEEFGDKE